MEEEKQTSSIVRVIEALHIHTQLAAKFSISQLRCLCDVHSTGGVQPTLRHIIGIMLLVYQVPQTRMISDKITKVCAKFRPDLGQIVQRENDDHGDLSLRFACMMCYILYVFEVQS